MCLYVNNGEPLVAKRNIVVFKNGDARVPIFQKFRSEHRTGFTYRRFVRQKNVELATNSSVIHYGYHSFVRPGRQIFIIPKGAKYYKGDHSDYQGEGYTSSSIIWIGSVFNPLNWLFVLLSKI